MEAYVFVDDIVKFSYEFLLGGQNIVYTYSKDGQRKLVSEKLKANNQLLFKYNYLNNKYENNILKAQLKLKKETNEIYVLSTFPLMVIDYNYDKTMEILK